MVYYNKIPIYPIFYLLKGDYRFARNLQDAGLKEFVAFASGVSTFGA